MPGIGADPGPLLESGSHRAPRFEHLTNEDGLSQVTVQSIVQDQRGFLWFGTVDGLNRFDAYELKIYKPDAGDPGSLSSATIVVLHQDLAGTLWVGTNTGLDALDLRHDRFTHYRHDPDDPASLGKGVVRALHEDRSGALWVGTDSDLNRLDPERERFTRYSNDSEDPTSLSAGMIRALCEDRSGTLWIGTDSGLSRLGRDGSQGTFKRYVHDPEDAASLSRGAVRAIVEDAAGALWVGTDSGLSRLESGSPEAARPRFVNYLHDAEDPASLGGGVWALVADRSGVLWIGTDGGGLNRFVPGSPATGQGRFIHYRHDTADPGSLGHDYVRSLYEDRSGILWIGTWAGGVSRLDPRRGRFLHYRHDPSDPASLSQDQVAAVHGDRAGNLWVGTFAGLDRLDADEGFVHYRHDPDSPTSLSHDVVTSVADDRDGFLWIGTLGGLNRIALASLPAARPGTGPTSADFTIFRHDVNDPLSLSHDTVFPILEDRSGVLWIGTWGGGLDSWDRGADPHMRDGFVHHRHDPEDPMSLPGNKVRCLLEDRSETLWVGTTSGLGRLDPLRQRFVQYRHDPSEPNSLSRNFVQTILEGRDGILWLGTAGGGLNRFDGGVVPASFRLSSEKLGSKSFRSFTEADGLANNHVYGILEDEDGRLWLSTNRGLSRFDPESHRFTNYDIDDGVQGFEFSQDAAHSGANGMMYFGGVHGLNAFRPDWFSAFSKLPPVVLTAFHVTPQGGEQNVTPQGGERKITPTAAYLEAVELNHRQNFFSFEFAAPSHTRPDKSRYAYRLEGLDTDWIDAGNRRYAAYTSVPPGEYLFRAKAANRDGVWNEDGVMLRLSIRPPFWATWWFRGAGIVVLIGLLWTVHEVRLQVLEQRAAREKAAERKHLIAELTAKNTELERFTYTVSHDLKSPLVTIQGFLGFLERDVNSGDAERIAGDMGRIRGAANKMQQLIDDLLELSRIGREANPPEDVALAELVGEVRELLAGEIVARGAEVVIVSDLPVVRGDRVRLQQLLQNLMQNALQYMGDQPAPRVEVGVRAGDGSRAEVFFVRDNGVGIAPEHQEQIFALFQRLDAETAGTGIGLALAQRIVEVHGGKIGVESEGPGRGSTFCFVLPEDGEGETKRAL